MKIISLLFLFVFLNFAFCQSNTNLNASDDSNTNLNASNDSNTSNLSLTSLNNNDDQAVKPNDIPFEALNTFVDIFNAIKENYVNPVDNEELINYAITGMLTKLDPHSAYLSDKEYHELLAQTSGEYAGIGVVLDIKQGYVQVVSALADSPAFKAGILTADRIIQINGQSIDNLNLNEIDGLFKSTAKDEMNLLIQRNNQLIPLVITKTIIHFNDIQSDVIDGNIAYLRINQFQDDSADAIKKEISALNIKYKITGLIIDLRNNPGGVLESAINSADLFLNNGTIVSIKGRDDNNVVYQANKGDILSELPIIVIINGGTASSAEIFAAALQDNQRAIIVGSKSFGKGSVQTLSSLYYGGAIKLTTALYYTPSGKSIQGQGILPQVTLHKMTSQAETVSIPESEASLANHIRISGNQTKTLASNDHSTKDSILDQAINLLKILQISHQTSTSTEKLTPETIPTAGADLAKQDSSSDEEQPIKTTTDDWDAQDKSIDDH